MTPAQSWVASANDGATDFPLQNLPCGVFSQGDDDPRCGVAIGDLVLDVMTLEAEGLIRLAGGPLLDVPFWNDVMEAGPDVWADLRGQLTALLAEGSTKQFLVTDHLVPLADVTLQLPFLVSEFTDFYAGRHHAGNVGTMLRDPANPLPPNWHHMPIAYNGRASSVVVSGTDVRRPWGQIMPTGEAGPRFAPTRRMDFELEIGAIVGQTSAGMVSVSQADAMIFGYVLLNDWSARDVQRWEAQPLGPFQSKAAATTIGAWIVTAAALAPFRVATPARKAEPMPHLAEPGPMLFDLSLEAALTPEGGAESVIARARMTDLSWSPAQALCHHTTSGCPMNVGDLLGSGTISGPEKGQRGSMLEASWGGAEPVALPGGLTRTFLEDGDTVTLRAHAQGAGFRVGFGGCAGRVIPAHADPVGAGR